MARPLEPVKLKGPLTEQELENCNETKFYYGFEGKPDYAAALQCGWYQRAHPQHTLGDMFYGPGVLTMLYANGKGVRRDYNLAIRFACENQWAAKNEMYYRISHLEDLQKLAPEAKDFDLCDDITSGLSDGTCTRVPANARDAIRERELNELLTKLSPAAKRAFPSLQAAETEFERARIAGEVDLSGTSRGAFQLEEETELREQFLASLRRFESAKVPAASASALSSLDRKLDEAYQQLQHSPASKWEFGTVKPEGIRATERKWVLLADAWAAFTRVAFPNLSPEEVRAELIRLRLRQLQSLGAD